MRLAGNKQDETCTNRSNTKQSISRGTDMYSGKLRKRVVDLSEVTDVAEPQR